MLPGIIRSPKMRFRRASKSGSLIFFGLAGGGDKRAMILPFLTISTCSPSATQFITVPKSRRSCRRLAVRWMEIRDYLRRESEDGKKAVKQIVFKGERFDVMSVRGWREKALGQVRNIAGEEKA